MIKLAIETDKVSLIAKGLKLIEELSLQIPRGTVFGVLGPRNSGKTSIIKLFIGTLKPSEGSLKVLGWDPVYQSSEIRRVVGILSNPPELYDSLNVLENMEFFAWAHKLKPEEREERIKGFLNQVNLWETRKSVVESLTPEEKIRLGLATVFLHRPPLVILDEPTTRFDPETAVVLRRLIASLISHQPGITVFLTTESQNEAKLLCEQVGIIRDGRVVKIGTPTELQLEGSNPQLEITGIGFPETIVEQLAEQTGVGSVEAREGNLIISFSEDFEYKPLLDFITGLGVQIKETRWIEVMDNIEIPAVSLDQSTNNVSEMVEDSGA